MSHLISEPRFKPSEEILNSLENEINEITLDEEIRKNSANCIERMLKVSK